MRNAWLLFACLAGWSCANPSGHFGDPCAFLFAHWGVKARACSASECPAGTIYILGRNVVSLNGQRVGGFTRGNTIEYDRTVSQALQRSIILHEIGHVLFRGWPHSSNRDDLMFPRITESEAPKYPSPREYLLAREAHRNRTFVCLVIP